MRGLGGETTHLSAAFTPEGGAYGHGPVHGHDHGHSHAHDHDHDHDHADDEADELLPEDIANAV